MKKRALNPKKIRLHRETLLQLDADQVAIAQGGATVGRACEPTSQCTATTGCSVTACGHC